MTRLTEPAEVAIATASADAAPQPSFVSNYRVLFFLLPAAIVIFNRVYIPGIHYDFLNVIPAAASLGLAYVVTRSKTATGQGRAAKTERWFRRLLFWRWVRGLLLVLLLFVAAEFGLRCFSYHRAMQYEQQEDLSFTPVPDQQYVEKISLTRSQTNHFGLRGKNVDLAGGKRTILCLGDSVTYGYGLDDEHTYPAQLQKHLDRQYPGHFLVLNAGVDAYPITLMREKFLSLWKQGVHPEVVIVGYSFNEGGVGHLIETDPEVRSRFSHALHLKNHLRGLALYNVLVENWGRSSYDRYKRYMISGADSGAVSPADLQHWYQHSLRELTDDLRARQVTPVFLLFAGLNGRTKQYDTRAPFQAHFQEFTEQNHLPLLLSSAAFGDTQPIGGFFLDQCHMSAKGTHAVGEALGEYLSHTMQR